MIQSDNVLKNIHKTRCENFKNLFFNCMKEIPTPEKAIKCKQIFYKYQNLCKKYKL